MNAETLAETAGIVLESCDNCRYALHFQTLQGWRRIRCRARPPLAAVLQDSYDALANKPARVQTFWPTVTAVDWCAAWDAIGPDDRRSLGAPVFVDAQEEEQETGPGAAATSPAQATEALKTSAIAGDETVPPGEQVDPAEARKAAMDKAAGVKTDNTVGMGPLAEIPPEGKGSSVRGATRRK